MPYLARIILLLLICLAFGTHMSWAAEFEDGAVAQPESAEAEIDWTELDEGEQELEVWDPIEPFNRGMFWFNDTLYFYLLKPVAKGYNWIMPSFLNKGVTNFFGNVDDIVVFFNSLLQLKFKQAVSTSARVVWNTTLGLAGFIDVATRFDLPKYNEDFGQTLAFWGVDSGPFFMLPFLGPSTVRDGLAVPVDWILFDPVFQDRELNVTLTLLAVRYTDKRADLLTATDIIDETAPDKYAYIRDAFLQRREAYLLYP